MNKKTSIFGDISKIDDSIDWDNIESIFRHKNSHKIEAIDELREKVESISEDLDSVPLKERFVLGPIIDGPGAYEYEASNYILEKLFKNLERARFLEKLSFSVKEENLDEGGSALVYEAAFSFKKRTLLEGLSFVRERLTKESIAMGSSKADSAFKFPHKLRRGTRWENITVEFLSNETVRIRAGKYTHDTNFKEMGFENLKTGKPNIKWAFLQALAARNGSISWGDGGDTKNKKLVQLLSDDLNAYFPIEYAPFEPYSPKKGYVLKATIFAPEGFAESIRPNLDEPKDWSQEIEADDDF